MEPWRDIITMRNVLKQSVCVASSAYLMMPVLKDENDQTKRPVTTEEYFKEKE